MPAADCVESAERVQGVCWLCGAYCWHARASVWVATSFRLHFGVHKYANAWWSLQIFACRNYVFDSVSFVCVPSPPDASPALPSLSL
jgi:hypothetical protein